MRDLAYEEKNNANDWHLIADQPDKRYQLQLVFAE